MNGQTARTTALNDQERLDLEAHLERIKATLPAGNVVSVEYVPETQLVRYRMADGTEKALSARNVLAGIRSPA